MRSVFVVALASVAASCVRLAYAQSCAGVVVGAASQCYALRTSCHYAPTNGTCQTGAPTTCTAYYGDTVGCAAASYGCTVNAQSGLCALTYAGAVDYCAATYTALAACTAGGCYWDAQHAKCYDSLATDNSIYACVTWTTQSACWTHGCNWSTGAGTCGNSTAGTGPVALSSSFVEAVSFNGAAVLANTVNFTVTANYPLVLNVTNPQWNWLRLGDFWSNTAYADNVTNANTATSYGYIPSYCSSHDSVYGDQPAPVNLANYGGVTLAQITTYITTWVNTHQNLDFSDGSNAGNAALALLGHQTAAGKVIQITAAVLSSAPALSITYSWSLQGAMYFCGTADLTQTVTSTSTTFATPVGAVQMQQGFSVPAQVSTTFISTLTTAGSTTVSATSRFIAGETMVTARSAQGACPAGSQSLTVGYELSYGAVYDATTQVGPRSATDIVPGTNCYGDTVTFYRFDGCNKYTCYFYVEITTACEVVTSAGTAFTTCTATPAEAALHPYTVNVYSCPLGQPASVSCVVGDVATSVSSTVAIQVYPSTTVTQTYAVIAGLLSSAQATSSSAFEQLTSTGNTTVDYHNTQLLSNQDLSVLLEMATPTLQAGFNLEINTYSSLFELTPLDAFGNPLAICAGQTISYATLYAYGNNEGLIYVPKDQQLLTPAAPLLPYVQNAIVQSLRGFDGFACAVSTLQAVTTALCGTPANGYMVTLPYNFIIGDASLTSFHTSSSHIAHHIDGHAGHAGGPRRRLQQATVTTVDAVSTNGTVTYAFSIVGASSATSSNNGWRIGSYSYGTSLGIVLGSIFGGIAVVGGGMWFGCRKRWDYTAVHTS